MLGTSFLYAMFGISAAFAVFAPSYFLTSTPCNRLRNLHLREVFICNSTSSTGSIVVHSSSPNTTSFHYRKLPQYSTDLKPVSRLNMSVPIAASSIAFESVYVLPGTEINFTMTTGDDKTNINLYILDAQNFHDMKFNLKFNELIPRSASDTDKTRSGYYVVDHPMRIYFAGRNTHAKDLSMNVSYWGEFTEYNFTTGYESKCTGTDCRFYDLSASSVVISDIEDGDVATVVQERRYHASAQAGWTVAGLSTWVAVVLFFVPNLTQERNVAKRKEMRLQKQRQRKLLEDEPDV